jgi:hypothetical protein
VAGLRGCGVLEDILTEAVDIENITQGQPNPLLRSRVGKLNAFARVAMWLGTAGGRLAARLPVAERSSSPWDRPLTGDLRYPILGNNQVRDCVSVWIMPGA